MTNPMRNIRIAKVTLNIGAGKEQKKLEKGMKLIEQIAGIPPVKTITNKRIPGFGLRPGLPIGCKLTLRGEAAEKIIKRLLEAKDNILGEDNFDDHGNISFGIHEYIDIPGAKYDPEIGVMGLQASITLERPGFRLKRRMIRPMRLNEKMRISQEESIGFMKEKFNIKMGESE